ncbi:UDP-glycosyltransferase 74e2 [Phtheirospermum japonicum]|uniref:Glycosyltransferase n=1 Tax=Phtheirospermum japonicum TaxID=374723 RepID=A0A830BDI7_9LAMI|nr:UDP-glycosyltransferase 74e2 [Phtheirospermum japonicum]
MDADGEYKAHCLIVPHPTQGHINPMLQFAKRLNQKGIQITLALTKFLLKTTNGFSVGSISVRSISDGFDDGGRAQAKSSEEYQSRFEQTGRETLAELINDLARSGRPTNCVVYDPFIPWVMDVAKGLFGLSAAAFFTQSCAVDSIYYHVYKGELKLPLAGGDEAVVVVPGLPALRPEEMPSFVYDYGSCPSTFQMVLNQFRNVDKADWIFINTFQKLEEKILEWMTRFWRVKAIGPTIPSMYLDNRLQDDREYGASIFIPPTNTCINWLNERQPKSVIYVSFGSLAQLSAQQTEEIASALKTCDKHFLWVIRSSEESKLPTNFSKEMSSKGLIVSWCPQLEVLAHEAVGCFITHCGWNSTLEGLSLGVPMVVMPQWTDQSTNAKFVDDVWGVGIRARSGEDGLVRREEIVGCVECVMDGDEGRVMSLNAIKWRDIAREAVDEGGSSDKNIEEFVYALVNTRARVI